MTCIPKREYIVCTKAVYLVAYLIVISWARVVCLIYTPEAEGHRPEAYANGFTVFIVVLIAFDCGFKLCLFYLFNLSFDISAICESLLSIIMCLLSIISYLSLVILCWCALLKTHLK